MIICNYLKSPIIKWLYKMKQMNEINQVQDDEIDLFELFQTLWDGKWLISAFVAIAVLLGGGFLLLKGAAYESKLFYKVDIIPPFITKKRHQLISKKGLIPLACLRNGSRIIVILQ